MELFFVTVIGACLGAIVRYTLPARQSYGAVLLPAVAAMTAAVVWVALLWLGLTFDGGWIWMVSIGASVVVPVIIALALPRRRRTSDAALFAKLTRA
jgi:predicted phage tail protein